MDDAANITKEIMNMGHLKSDGHEITQTAFIISLPFLVPLIIYGIRLLQSESICGKVPLKSTILYQFFD